MLAAPQKLLKLRASADAADWSVDLNAQIADWEALVNTGADGQDDVQTFLTEVVWAVLRGELPPARASELLQRASVPSSEALQQLLADVLWLVGFSATELPTTKEAREAFLALCSQLEADQVLPKQLLATSLESDHVPPAICQVAHLKKKQNQAKTKAKYTITRYNLLREHTEGYAQLAVVLGRLANLEFQPEASPEEMVQTTDSLTDDVVRIAGFCHLCPNRTLAMALDMYEQCLLERDPRTPFEPILAFMQRFPKKRLTEVIVFQLLSPNALAPPPTPGRDPRSAAAAAAAAPARPSQLLVVARLVAAGLVELDTIWSYLEPADSVLKEQGADLLAKYEDEVSNVFKVDLGSSSSTSRHRDNFGRAMQQFNQASHQKFQFVAALIGVNCWSAAHKVLLHLQQLCKPCMNHYVRAALCDLLKWLIDPLLRQTGKKPVANAKPSPAKPSLQSSYLGVRRFVPPGGAASEAPEAEAGAGAGAGAAAASSCLRPEAELEPLIPQLRQVLDHLEYFLHTDLHLLTSLWRVLALHLKQREPEGNGKGGVALDDQLVAIIYRHLLPAASLVPHNPSLSDHMWIVLSQLPVFQRFLIYSCWETMYDGFLLRLVFEKTRAATKQILKRVVSNAERRDLIAHQSHFHFCKLCHSNPLPAIETMLKDVEIGFNVNMIQPYVECTNRCADITADIMGFVLARSCARPVSANRVFLDQKDATLSPWLVNLGEFAGRFYKKHPQTDLVGLLSIITKKMNIEAAETGPSQGPFQVEYKGESLIRVVLENLIEFMGGLVTVSDMTADQLHCLAGGPRLRSESIAIGKKEDSSRKERARQSLLASLVDLGLVPVLWYSLSEQRHHFLSEDFSEAHGGAGGLKLLGLLFDGNHECFLKVTEFLSQACTREKYLSLLPPLEQVFSIFEPALAFLAIRAGLPHFGRSPAGGGASGAAEVAQPALPNEPAPAPNAAAAAGAPPSAAAAATAAADGAAAAAGGAAGAGAGAVDGSPSTGECEVMVELERVVRLYLPKTFETDGLSMLFYKTFWRLSVQDICKPSEGYEKTIAQLQASIKHIEASKKQHERAHDRAHMRDYKALKKEGSRLQEVYGKLKEEELHQAYNYQKVIAALEQDKNKWFLRPSPQATCAFVAEMICPRVLTSYADALFCCNFVRLLIKLKTPGFQLLDFYNSWTAMLTQMIRCCSEREARIFGVFLQEMMSYILNLRKDEAAYNTEMTGNPCFHRNYYENPATERVEWAQFGDIKKGHSKWEGRIYKAIRQGLEAEDWMERRNTLLLLSQSNEAFPVVEKYASAILKSVEILHEKEEFSDLKTLAKSLAVKLTRGKEHWVDKTPLVEQVASSRRPDDKDGRRPKNSLATSAFQGGKADPLSSTSKAASGLGDGKDRDRDGKGKENDGKQDGNPEKRARREGDGLKEGKEPKEPKEAKEAKRGDRIEGKESKRPTSERPREKEPGGLGDRKTRGSGGPASGGVPQPPRAPADDRGPVGAPHDDRPEKRRRAAEREGGSIGDRHVSSSIYSSSTRNALTTSPPDPGGQPSSREDYSRRGGTGYTHGGGSSGGGGGGRYERRR